MLFSTQAQPQNTTDSTRTFAERAISSRLGPYSISHMPSALLLPATCCLLTVSTSSRQGGVTRILVGLSAQVPGYVSICHPLSHTESLTNHSILPVPTLSTLK